jgi:lysophospholipase L1-like esterase
MNRTTKLLSLTIAVLIVFAGFEAFMVATIGNKNQPSPIRIACVGDSITRGTEYTLDLWAMLGPNYIVGDFGVGGATVSQQSESAYMNKNELEVAKQFQPNIVVVMLGTNDADKTLNESQADFVSDYVALLLQFQALPNKPAVYIVEPPPIYNSTVNLSGTIFAQTVLPGIKEVANQTGLPLIDAYSPLVGYPDYFVDGIHPKAEGAQIIAEAVYAALKTSN